MTGCQNPSIEGLAQQARLRMAQQQQHYQQKGSHPHHMDQRRAQPHHMDPRGGQSHHMDPRGGQLHRMDPRGVQSHHMDPRGGQPHHMDPRGGQPHHMDPRGGQPHHMPLQDQRGAQFLPHQHPSQVEVLLLSHFLPFRLCVFLILRHLSREPHLRVFLLSSKPTVDRALQHGLRPKASATFYLLR